MTKRDLREHLKSNSTLSRRAIDKLVGSAYNIRPAENGQVVFKLAPRKHDYRRTPQKAIS